MLLYCWLSRVVLHVPWSSIPSISDTDHIFNSTYGLHQLLRVTVEKKLKKVAIFPSMVFFPWNLLCHHHSNAVVMGANLHWQANETKEVYTKGAIFFIYH